MSYRWDKNDDEQVRAMLIGAGCLATVESEGRITDGAESRKRRQIMVHP
jgi:hypothetical protein